MIKENRIQNIEYRSKSWKQAYAKSVSPFGIKCYKIPSGRILIIGFFILGIFLSGCGANTKNAKSGLTETQIEAYKIINDSLNSDNPLIRVNAIEISANTKQENYLPTIHNMLKDRFVPVRFSAAVAIGEMQYAPALNSINELLRDRDPNVLVAASYAMARLGHPEYLQVLRESVNSNENQTIKANSALLLGKIGDKSSIQLLRKLMENPDSSDMVSYQAAEALAMLGDTKIYETIWAMLISTFNDVRYTGVKAMGALGTPQAENALLSMLSDPVVEIRVAAAEQLGKMNNKKGKNAVLEVFQKKLYLSQDMQSRERILTLTSLAIGEIGTKDLTKFLPDLMKNESPLVRLAAAKAVFTSSLKF
ncbi:MAG: HEAT repeat domain-containing protein [Sedimentisphaerales bacterium]|nr:HEAT repeat domain-containing protein [Sedimentisphaerales bacterium]